MEQWQDRNTCCAHGRNTLTTELKPKTNTVNSLTFQLLNSSIVQLPQLISPAINSACFKTASVANNGVGSFTPEPRLTFFLQRKKVSKERRPAASADPSGVRAACELTRQDNRILCTRMPGSDSTSGQPSALRAAAEGEEKAKCRVAEIGSGAIGETRKHRPCRNRQYGSLTVNFELSTSSAYPAGSRTGARSFYGTRSKRPAFITLFQAATKSFTNLFCESSLA